MKMKYSKKGDQGETSLMGGQRILKCDARPETYGTLDEASFALGIARASSSRVKMREIVLSIQKDLAVLGAELATLPEDACRFPHRITGDYVERLDGLINELQDGVAIRKEFIYPGASLSSAAIDLARTIIRRGNATQSG
jgi:cob(I)alamin adenosyltransferase